MIAAGDRVKVIDFSGNELGEATVINVNEFREPELKYAIMCDFHDDDFIFVGKENLIKIKEEN